MGAQFITTEGGEELVVLSRRDYEVMLARAGDGIHMSMNGYRLLTEGLARHLVHRATAAHREASREAAAPASSAATG